MVVSTCTHAFIHPSIHLFLYLSVYLSVCLCTPIHKAQTAGAAEDWQIILVQIETNLNRFIFEIKCRKLIGESVYQIKSKEKMDTMYFASRRKDDRKFIFILSLFRSWKMIASLLKENISICMKQTLNLIEIHVPIHWIRQQTNEHYPVFRNAL